MRSVRSKNTKPEMAVRKAAFALGFRFRIHVKDLPGTPDIAIKSRKKAIFVHGCFWHRHKHCKRATMPSTNVEFWFAKFARNIERDRAILRAYRRIGWSPLVVWECQVERGKWLASRLTKYLGER